MTAAPKKSLRPQSRAHGAAKAETRVKNAADVAKFGDTELLADLNQFLRNDAVARLGYKNASLRYLGVADGRGTSSAFSTGASYPVNKVMGPKLSDRYNATYPEDAKAIPENSVVYDDVYAALPVLAHELRHIGYNKLQASGMAPSKEAAGAPDEAVVEVGDLPALGEKVNYPARVRVPGGATSWTMASTMDQHGYNGYEVAAQQQLRGLYEAAQQAALTELQAQGEPPQAVRRKPQGKSFLKTLFGG